MNFKEFLETYLESVQIEENLAVGSIDGSEKFEEFRNALRKRGYTFTTRSSRKENYSFEVGPNQKLPGRGSLMYKSSSDVSVPFFGFPFVVETTTYYTCSQGIKYYASKRYPDEMFEGGDPLAKRRRQLKISRKIGCPARMTVKKIKVFTSQDYFVSRDNWRDKKAAIDILRRDLAENKEVECLTRYFLLLSLDSVHNHDAVPRTPQKPKNPITPAKKVVKLQKQISEALGHIDSSLLKCTNVSTLMQCCTGLKTIINSINASIEKNDGVAEELVEETRKRIEERQAAMSSKKTSPKKKSPKSKKDTETNETNETTEKNTTPDEIPAVLEAGGQGIWDYSYVLEGQGFFIQQDGEDNGDGKQILVQRRVNDIIAQGGQNYTIVQHSGVPNLISTPVAIAKMVTSNPPINTSPNRKGLRKDDVNVAIAIPAGVDWSQQNWGQQLVVSGDHFAPIQTPQVWNIAQE